MYELLAQVSFALHADEQPVNRRDVPSGLQAALFEEEETILRVFGGPKGQYYLRTPSRYCEKNECIPSEGSLVHCFLSIDSSGIANGVPRAEITLITFGPAGGWFAVLSNGRWLAENVPLGLLERARFLGGYSIGSVSLGANGSWAVTSKSGGYWTHNTSARLNKVLSGLGTVKVRRLHHAW